MFVLGFALAICLTPLSEFFLNLIPNLFKEEPLDTNDRIRCPGFRDEATCKSHGCVHARVSHGPSCFMKKDSFGFKIEEVSESRDGMEVRLSNLSENTPYGPSLTSVNVSITYITAEIVRVKFLDNQNERFQVPVQNEFPLLQERQKVDRSSMAYEVLIHNKSDIFSFQIKRLKDQTVLWDTSIGGLMLSDQFLQISSYIPSKNIYGLGESTHRTLRHPLMYNTWPMFTRDQFPEGDNMNLYGVHPFYTCLENSTNSHGVLFLNSNAM
ncbi:sucrase-isomaltase, intestinal, partial [Trichonephila clavata]